MHTTIAKNSVKQNLQCSQRIFYLDLLRAIACIFVVIIHSCMGYISQTPGTFDFWIANIFDAPSRIAVPLFIMISGALMLDENYVFTKQKWIRHIKKLLVFFLFWSFTYWIIFDISTIKINQPKNISLVYLFIRLLNGHYHLWFIPMILGLYFLTPLFRLWVNSSNSQFVKYYLILSFIFSFAIPQALTIVSGFIPLFKEMTFFNNMDMQSYLGYSSYYLLGWYLSKKRIKVTLPFYYLAILAVSITFFGIYAEYILFESGSRIFYQYFTVNVLFQAIAVFILCKANFECHIYMNTLFHRTIKLIADNSLGIYAVHAAIISMLTPAFSHLSAILAIPVIFSLCVAISLITVSVFSKNPFLRKFV